MKRIIIFDISFLDFTKIINLRYDVIYIKLGYLYLEAIINRNYLIFQTL